MQKKRIKTACLLILSFFIFSEVAFAQENKKIDITLNNVTLKEFLATIEKQTDYTFMYKNLDLTQKITINVKNTSLSNILKEVLAGRNIRYEFSEKRIYLTYTTDNVPANEQKKKINISGFVTDDQGSPLLGVTVSVPGTTVGTMTNVDGKYELVTEIDATIRFSFVGFINKQEKVNSRTQIDVQLQENLNQLADVVVVGYGTQKKVNLTGAVAMVDRKALENRPIINAVAGLQGTLPGVTITTSGNRPGDSNLKIRVRGEGTIGNSNPLILIDGVEGNLSTLNPDDIESVSVLKDAASSAIYGSRAANGVILVTTKRVERDVKPLISYTGYYAIQMPVSKPKMLGSLDYLTLLKEATSNVGKNFSYSNADIQAIKDGTNPNYLANTNWVDEVWKDTAPQNGHNLSINGGTKDLGYYASYGHLGTDGLVVNNAYRSSRNNTRVKIDSEVLDRIRLEANFSYTDVDNSTPSVSDNTTSGLFYQALRSSPLVPVRFTDGRWGYGGSSANPVAMANDGGFINYKSQATGLNVSATVDIIKGLTLKGQYGTTLTNVLRKQQTNKVAHYYPDTETFLAYSSATSSIAQRDVAQKYQSATGQLDYDKKINKHSFHILVGASQEWQNYSQMDASREDLVSNELHELNAGTGKRDNSGYSEHWAIRSGFGRINYNFDDRYLFEFNLRYDLSSRFHKDHRGGYFPSASLAWRISEESFMLPTRSFLDNLKLRLSYGELGNQYTNSLYPYMSVIEPSDGMPIGGEISSSLQQTLASNKSLTWETIKMTNIGLDFTVLNNRLSVTADYFIKNTDDILLKVNRPGVIGVGVPYVNAGKVQNKGWEVNLAWSDKIGKNFDYGFNFNLSDIKNKIKSLGEAADDFSGKTIKAVGYPIDAFWGYQADGLADFGDFNYNPTTDRYNAIIPIIEAYRTKYGPGDIKWLDLDNSGAITPEGDRTYLGNSIPRYTFSFGGNMKYKSVDFQFFFQGVGKCDGLIDGLGRHAFTELANYPQKAHLGRWTFENPNINASYPRFTYDENYNQSNLSSFWIEDASYLRLKNVQLGYNLPKEWLSKLRVQNCRVYFSGENLLTFTDFYDSYDPETPNSGGGYYPVTKSVSIGISLTLR